MSDICVMLSKNPFIYKHKHYEFFDAQALTSNTIYKTLTLWTDNN